MSKIAIITDTHGGVKSNLEYFHNHISKFYDFFHETLKKQNIKRVIHCGDIYDNRRNVNILSVSSFNKMFVDKLSEKDIKTYYIVGNHDTYFKNTNEINTPDLIIKQSDNRRIYKSPCTIDMDGVSIDLIPWINESNYESFTNMIKTSKSAIAFGHLEIEGFAMYKGFEARAGMSPSIFQKYESVYSGHYHTKSTKGNITYLGAPYEITWSDYDDPRGFHIFDTETREMEFIQNPYTLFEKIVYDETKLNLDVEKYKGKVVKIVIINRKDFVLFDMFIDKLEKAGVAVIKIEEDLSDYTETYEDEVDPADTLNVLETYVKGLDIEEDEKTTVKTLLTEVYVEACNRE